MLLIVDSGPDTTTFDGFAVALPTSKFLFGVVSSVSTVTGSSLLAMFSIVIGTAVLDIEMFAVSMPVHCTVSGTMTGVVSMLTIWVRSAVTVMSDASTRRTSDRLPLMYTITVL